MTVIDWEYKRARYEKLEDEHIAIVTMDYPEKLNPMSGNSDLMDGVRAAVDDVNNDPNMKVLIVQGAGRAFSSGADVDFVGHYYGESWQTPKPGEKFTPPRLRHRLSHDIVSRRGMEHLYDCTKLTIAKVHGYCLGGGFDIAAACDLVISSDDAVYGHPYWRFVGPGGDQNIMLYTMLMGIRRATEMMFTTRWISAEEAEKFGFVNKVVPLDELDEQTLNWARGCALMAADGIVAGKAVLALMRNIWGARLGYHVSGMIHSIGVDVHYEDDEFNLMKHRRDEGYRTAIKQLRERYDQYFPEPPTPVSMKKPR